MATSWVCKDCGTQNEGKALRCLGCGKTAPLLPVVLTCPTSGHFLRTSQRLRVGRALLARFGADAKFASEPQFELIPDLEAGTWRVVTCAAARNRTCYAGAPVESEGVVLEVGGMIELGPGKLRLRVGLEGG
jgi:hypothetical protein